LVGQITARNERTVMLGKTKDFCQSS